MSINFVTELKNLGLSDKESAVYLASLELGPSPVQAISRQSKVVRATTYVVLDSLAQRGLVTQYKEGKKTLFAPQPPRQLMRLLEKQEEEINEKKHELDLLLPELQAVAKGDDDATVRYFEGKEGLQAIRREIVMHSDAGEEILNFTPADHLIAVFPDNKDTQLRQRLAKKIKAKTLFSTESEALKKKWLEDLAYSERRYISPSRAPFSAGITIYGDRIAFGSFSGKLIGAVIESKVIADAMRVMFMMAWEVAGDKAAIDNKA